MSDGSVFNLKLNMEGNVPEYVSQVGAGIKRIMEMGEEAMRNGGSAEAYAGSSSAGIFNEPRRGVVVAGGFAGGGKGPTGGLTEEQLKMLPNFAKQMQTLGDQLYLALETAITRFKTHAMTLFSGSDVNLGANVAHDVAWSQLQARRRAALFDSGLYGYEGENRAVGQVLNSHINYAAAQKTNEIYSMLSRETGKPVAHNTLDEATKQERLLHSDIGAEASTRIVKAAHDRAVLEAANGMQQASLFQHLQAQFSPGGSPAFMRPTMGQFMGRHALNTMGYALPGIAIGVGFEEMRRALEESQKAQRSQAEMRAQFEGLGQGSQFAGFNSSVKQIASATGVAVSEVTQLGMAMKGVYGDTLQATVATKGITQATVTMGMSLQEARQDMTAISQGFQDLASMKGSAQTAISNMALHLQDVTGVEAKDLVPGTADVAPTANAAGFGSYQTMAMVAAAAQHSGLSSATIGETLSKIITGLSANGQTRSQVENMLQGNGLVAGNIQSQSLSAQIQAVMTALPKLSGSAQEQILTSLGLNASAIPAANALGASAGEAQTLAKTPPPSNRAAEEFKKQMDTLSARLQQLRADFTNLGVEILQSGFGKAITEIADVAGLSVRALSDLNKATHGAYGDLALLGAGLLAFRGLKNTIELVTQTFNALKRAVEQNIVSEEESTTANQAGGASALLGRGAALAGTGLNAAMGVGLAATTGWAIGTQIYNSFIKPLQDKPLSFNQFGENTGGSGVKTTSTNNGKVVTGRVEDFKKLLDQYNEQQGEGYDVTNPLGSTKHAKQQEAFINQNRGRLQAVMATMPKNIQKLFGFDLQHDQYQNAYEQILQLYSQYGQTQAGQSAIGVQIANSGGPSLQQQRDTAVAKYLTNLHNNILHGEPAGALSGYENQQLSSADTLATLTNNVNSLKQTYQQSGSAQDYANYQQALTQMNQFLDNQAQMIQQTAQQALQNGNPANDAKIVTGALQQLQGANGLQAMIQAWSNVQSAVRQGWQDQMNAATTGLQAINAGTQSYTMPLDQQQRMAAAAGMSLSQWQAVNNGGTIQGYLSGKQKYGYQQQDVAAQQALGQAFAVEDPVKVAIANAQAAAQNYQNAVANEGQNSNDATQAKAAMLEAQQAVVDAQNQSAQSMQDLLAAQFSNAPLQAAQYTLQKLQIALQDAHGVAAQNQIKAQIMQTEQQIAQAMIQNADAQSAIVQATLTAQGNPIAAAQEKYQQDLRDIASRRNFDAANGVNQAQDTQLQQMIAQSISDSTNVLQTQFSTLTQTTQNELYLGQITATQAIIMLEQGMAAAKGNALLVQQYQTAIRQIQNSAGANLNFDLPQNLLIQPTLYQAARVNQLGGGAYQGSRQVTVTINVNNSSQNPAAVQQLINALGGPPVGSIVSSPLASPGL